MATKTPEELQKQIYLHERLVSDTRYPDGRPLFFLILIIVIFAMIDLTDSSSWIASNLLAVAGVCVTAWSGLYIAKDYYRKIRPSVNLITREGEYCLENVGSSTATQLKITLFDPMIDDMESIHGRYLIEYVERKIKENPHFNQTILSLGPNQKVSGSLFTHFKSYEAGLKDRLEGNNLEYDPNHGTHIWNYKVQATVEFEDTDGKKYKEPAFFDLSQVKGSAIPPGPGDSEYKKAKLYLETR